MFLPLLIAALSAPVPPGHSAYLPPNLYLVRVTTLKVWKEPKERFDRGRLKVTAVLGGPLRLLNQEFEVTTKSYADPGGSRIAPYPPPVYRWVPILEKGIEGLWWVYENPKDKALTPELRLEILARYRLTDFPFQNDKAEFSGWRHGLNSKDMWKEGEEWAKAVAAVYDAKTDADRRALLEKFAAAERSPVALWAMGWLVRGGAAEPTAKFLRTLVTNDKLDAPSQIALDEFLCRLDAKEWVKSADRRKMLDRWLEGKPDAAGELFNYYLFQYACCRLEEARATGELDAQTFTDVLAPVIRRKELNKGQIFELRKLVSSRRFKKEDAEVMRTFWTEVSTTAPDSTLQLRAYIALNERDLP